MPQDQNRRRHSRFISGIEARLKSPTGKVFHGHSRDISCSGAYIYCEEPIYIASAKECLLKLIFQEGDGIREVCFRCRCIRTDNKGFAVEFLSIRKGDLKYFTDILEKLSETEQTFRDEYKRFPHPPEYK